jgi:hypothetical protein
MQTIHFIILIIGFDYFIYNEPSTIPEHHKNQYPAVNNLAHLAGI